MYTRQPPSIYFYTVADEHCARKRAAFRIDCIVIQFWSLVLIMSFFIAQYHVHMQYNFSFICKMKNSIYITRVQTQMTGNNISSHEKLYINKYYCFFDVLFKQNAKVAFKVFLSYSENKIIIIND